jgi:hypothetical protein
MDRGIYLGGGGLLRQIEIVQTNIRQIKMPLCLV